MMNMITTYGEIEKAISRLDDHEKAVLAHAILKDLDGDDDNADVEALWIEESEKRLDAYLDGELQTTEGDEAMARLRNSLK